jgi:hypothetical protein
MDIGGETKTQDTTEKRDKTDKQKHKTQIAPHCEHGAGG